MFDDLKASVSHLNQNSLETQAINLLADVFLAQSLGRTALVSSFGAESAVLLHLLSRVDRTAPVLFIDTRMLFPETIEYQLELTKSLSLSNVKRISPSENQVRVADPEGSLNKRDPDSCCYVRKVIPLEKALSGFDAWITGRKRHQASSRQALQVFEADPATGRIKLNPLAFWNPENVRTYMDRHKLPKHPLVETGYPSIGCIPCTSKVKPGENPRAGRWRGREKSECGIHNKTATEVGEA